MESRCKPTRGVVGYTVVNGEKVRGTVARSSRRLPYLGTGDVGERRRGEHGGRQETHACKESRVGGLFSARGPKAEVHEARAAESYTNATWILIGTRALERIYRGGQTRFGEFPPLLRGRRAKIAFFSPRRCEARWNRASLFSPPTPTA